AAGNLYVADLGNSRVQKFAADGSYLTKWGNWGSGTGQFKNPWGVAVAADGYVYVADSGNNRMQKFTSTGGYVSQWGSAGPNPGQLNDPGAVDVGYSAQGAAEVYVVDSASYRVQKFSAGGDYLRQWGSATNTDQLWRPRGLALGLTGDVYVADANNSRVQVYSPAGTWLRSWGSLGTGAGQFDAVSDIAIDGAGRVFVAETPHSDAYPPRDDPANHRVQVFTAAGGLLTTFGISGTAPGEFRYPNGLDLDTAGHLYVADTGNNRVQKLHFDAATNTLAFVQAWGAYGTDPGQFYYPSGIAVDAARGVLYVGDTRNHRIQKFTLDGVFVKTWGTLGTGAGQFDLTSGVAVDADGNVYVTDGQNLSRPGTSPLNQRVQKFTSEGVFVTQWGSSGGLAGEFYQPDGIAVDPAGEVYVVDSGNDRVQVFGLDYPALDPVSGLVQNGAFEAGLAGWASGGGLSVSLEAGSGQTGAAVRLGAPVPATAQGEGQAWLQQTIYVNPAWSTPRLSVAYRALTNHTTDYSDLLVGVQDAAGLQHLATALRDGCSTVYQPPAATDLGWRTGSLDLSAFKGSSIRLTLYNRNLWPGSKGIWTYIDDVRVVEAGPALPYRFFLPLTIRPGTAPLCP
ncbi:MAG: SMP-30/gluconolactonase/LRE family protein, partial [Anaerolineales bacterium]|nr:SMP-30/gluconolactonase/LRE family protein [Anaerolineales bacterium]